MPKCPKCYASIPSYGKVCPECGAPVDASADALAAPSSREDTVHSILLHANLLKIRGDSDSAIAECIKALRINPDSLEAHILLGDIYKIQGKEEEAMQWYELALDLSPDNKSSREKLDHISIKKSPSTKPAETPSDPPVWKFNIITAQTVVICILVLAVGFLWVKPLHKKPHAQTTRVSVTSPTVAPQTPVVAPDVKPADVQVGNHANTSPPSADPDAAMLKELNALPSLANENLIVTSTSYDPRYDTESITFVSPTADTGLSGRAIIRQSLVVARGMFAMTNAPSNVTVRAISQIPENGSTSEGTVFVGDTTKEKAMLVDPDSSSYDEQLAAFDKEWWNQDVK